MRTIRELAEECNVSKTMVRKRLQQLELTDQLITETTNRNRKLVPEDVYAAVLQSFIDPSVTENRKISDNGFRSNETQVIGQIISNTDFYQHMLTEKEEQLKVKDEQIAFLQSQLTQATDLYKELQKRTVLLEEINSRQNERINSLSEKILLLEEPKNEPITPPAEPDTVTSADVLNRVEEVLQKMETEAQEAKKRRPGWLSRLFGSH